MRKIPRNIFNKERSVLKNLLNINYDAKEKYNRFGPPSIFFQAKFIRKHEKEFFLEECVKCGILTRHPLGGYMDARYAKTIKEIMEEIVKGDEPLVG